MKSQHDFYFDCFNNEIKKNAGAEDLWIKKRQLGGGVGGKGRLGVGERQWGCYPGNGWRRTGTDSPPWSSRATRVRIPASLL